MFLHILTEFSKNFRRVSFILMCTPAQILRREDCNVILGTQLLHALLNEAQKLLCFILFLLSITHRINGRNTNRHPVFH